MSSIPHKKKPCEGTTSETRGFGCGKPTYYRKQGLGTDCGCYFDWLTKTESGKKKMDRNSIKRTTTPIKKKSSNPIPRLLETAVDACHRYIKFRDQGKPCICCGAKWSPEFQASHYFKAELYSTIKFYEYNIHGGCPICNEALDGNIEKYAENLPGRIGKDKFDELVRLSELDKKQSFKWDRQTLRKIIKYYRTKLKECREKNTPTPTEPAS